MREQAESPRLPAEGEETNRLSTPRIASPVDLVNVDEMLRNLPIGARVFNLACWRWRRCPSCRSVFPAGRFQPVRFAQPWTPRAEVLRRCPGCGYVASTWSFHVVRERHAAKAVGS